MSITTAVGKITFGEFIAACKAAGIREDDPLDRVDVSWGTVERLECTNDEDFGWQITLDVES